MTTGKYWHLTVKKWPTASTLIRHENGAFQKLSSNRKNMKTTFFNMKQFRCLDTGFFFLGQATEAFSLSFLNNLPLNRIDKKSTQVTGKGLKFRIVYFLRQSFAWK